MQTLTIPTTDEIRVVVRDELAAFFASNQFQPPAAAIEEFGDIDFASKLTGKAVATIYDLVSKRLIPHSKRGKKLYFSRRELTEWITSGKRKTQDEKLTEYETAAPHGKDRTQPQRPNSIRKAGVKR